MKKFKLNTACLIDNLKEHKDIRDTLISLIKDTKADILDVENKYSKDLIHKLDFNNSIDDSRKWVQLVKPHLQNYFNKCAKKLGYQTCNITNLWFQQYNKNGQHGWHIHGGNYTGIYYVKFSNKSAKTELMDPFSQDKKIIINAKEGDIVVFPSYVIHRATEQKNNEEKIIISFNFDFDFIQPYLFNRMDVLKGKNYDK